MNLKKVQRLLSRSPAKEEVLNIYARVEERLPHTTIIVIDRIDKLAERHRVDIGDLIAVLHADLAERGKAQLIMVQEQPRLKGLEAYSDGCLTLKTFSDIDTDFTGQMEVSKLAGVDIGQLLFWYKIKGGRFKILPGARPL